jgi:hypothetical protein
MILRRAAARCSQEHHRAHGFASAKHAGEDTNALAQKSMKVFECWDKKGAARMDAMASRHENG